MRTLLGLALCLGLVTAAPQGSKTETKSQTKDIDYLMPNVQPKQPDTYLCLAMKMSDVPAYLVGFKPHANKNIAHHILLYGCQAPGHKEGVWNCGEMAQKGHDYRQGPVCASGNKILYAWAMDAPSLSLPEGVGFEVGGHTDVQYLVLQVHYKDVTTFLPPQNGHDKSGITMVVTDTPMPRRAGVYLLGTGGHIPAHETVYMETACSYTEPFEIHPFAFRTHAHSLGKVVSGYRIRNGEWTEIGRKSPQLPQMFYNATTPGMTVKNGDILAARCTMKNDLDHDVDVGSTQNDEMCNFYVMYYVDGDQTMHSTSCFTMGPSYWYWKDFRQAADMRLDHVPKTVSVVPGTDDVIEQTVEEKLYDDSSDLDTSDLDSSDLDTSDLDDLGDPYELLYETQDPVILEKLMAYLQARGPQAYGDEDFYPE